MAGISSKALAFGDPGNKWKYNGIEVENALGIDDYEAQLRNLDPQVGRWWEIDPKTENQEAWSPYVSNNDNPVKYSDPLGDEADDCCKEIWNVVSQTARDVTNFSVSAVNAFVTNQVGGYGRGDASSFSDPHDAAVSRGGQIFGDLTTLGVAAIVDIGGGAISVASLGTLAVPMSALMAKQTVIAAPTAFKNLIDDFKPQERVNSNGSSTTQNTGNQSKNAVNLTPSKVQKSTTIEKIGDFEKKIKVEPSKKSPGQSRAEYVTYKNKEGKTIRTHKDSYDRANKFQGRKPLRGGPEGRSVK